VVTNACGIATSNPAVLTVNTMPSIATPPSPVTACAGSGASFSVAASGSFSFTYQWRKNGSNIPGATGASYAIASTISGDAGNYDVVVSNGCGVATSAAAALTVNAQPKVTSPPAAQAVCQGARASFSANASGTPPLTWQWRK